MNILVTGGAGYVGSHVCKALYQAGINPIVYDNLSRGSADAVKWGPLEQGDLLDLPRLLEVFKKTQPAAVFPFAGFIQVGESVQNPLMYYKNHLEGAIHLLEAMHQFEVKQLIFSSTAAVYGNPETLPLKEEHRLRPINPYGSSKLMTEQLLQVAEQSTGLRHISFRYFNAAGADPDCEVGECHEPETHLIPRVLKVAAGLLPELVVHGTDYATQDGTCVRDYVHVSDLAQAHVLALNHLKNGGSSAVYNLGSRKGYSVREVIAAAEEVTGRKIPFSLGGRREGDTPILISDPTAAERALGWRPLRPDIRQILETAWRWELRQHV